ncbi:MAG: PQQ-binding-like beta-propeller repeat protein [Streptosporangiaceae bacterium]
MLGDVRVRSLPRQAGRAAAARLRASRRPAARWPTFRWLGPRWLAAGLLVAGLLVAGALAAGPQAAAGPAAPGARAAAHDAAGSTWTVYHATPAGTGVAAGVTAVRTGRRAWTSPRLDGDIYGEPLVFAGRVYVATENDTVYALSAATGKIAWSAHLGTPVPAGSLPCGDITPTVGITGTPVIAAARREIFAVADVLSGGRPAHLLVGLSTQSGRQELRRDVDPPGAQTAALLQRTGLALAGGQVVFGFGGNYGDCPRYRGHVVAVPEAGGAPRFYTVDSARGESQGAIWMGGAAPAVDGRGHIWVTAGNGSVHTFAHPYDYSDSVLELSPGMRLLQYFAPVTWASDNASDLDFSTEPALLADGQVIAAGKSGDVYLLTAAHLGGIGGQRATLRSACGGVIDGGSAVTGETVFLPCKSGIIAVQASASPPPLRLLWRSGTGGGPPILAGGLVWTIGQDGTLSGLSPGTGQVRQQVQIGAPANHFPTPSAADGLLLAAAARQVVAFPAASGQSPAASSGTASTPAAQPGRAASRPAGTASAAARPPSAGRSLPPAAIAGIAAAGLLVLAGLGWLLRRARTPP